MVTKTALITGITGQDGSYLAELLLARGYRVCGVLRPGGAGNLRRIEHLRGRLDLFPTDWQDQTALTHLLHQVQPAEVYNLAASSFVPDSWQQPVLTAEVMALSVTRLLDALRQVCPQARLCQASSSEMFGKPRETPQRESTPFQPRTPYGVAKLYGHHITATFRERYGLFACCAILFNHESPRRGLEFVTRKISHGVARIKFGLATQLRLGNLQARRDWGFAGDYVRALWLMLQQEQPDDYVIGTGQAHRVEDVVRIAFTHAGLKWQDHVVAAPEFYRPADAELLLADPTRARQRLGWQPQVTFEELVQLMVDADLAEVRQATRRPVCGVA
jgi:GDPmannose 4,6-dehydratase